jgi:hypothetical protein
MRVQLLQKPLVKFPGFTFYFLFCLLTTSYWAVSTEYQLGGVSMNVLNAVATKCNNTCGVQPYERPLN